MKISCYGIVLLCALLSLAVSPAGAQEKTAKTDVDFPYTLGAAMELNMFTREGSSFGYGAALDRYIIPGYILGGLRGVLSVSGDAINTTEAEVYLRLNMAKIDVPIIGGYVFSQFAWGFTSLREETNTLYTFSLNYTLGYRAFFLGGFYVEPYVRAGYPVRMAAGVSAGHWFNF
ncbi:MAG: hypothetical protein LBR23_02570 [Spirochaetaceae bacterium]|jgi:hypothetical protein|nr:hypothetical protein [Spirochaetaceae bacterium]